MSEAPPSSERPPKELPEERSVATSHRVCLGGRELDYTATVSTLHLRDADATPTAEAVAKPAADAASAAPSSSRAEDAAVQAEDAEAREQVSVAPPVAAWLREHEAATLSLPALAEALRQAGY